MLYNFTYCPFSLAYTETLVDTMRTEIESVPQNMWHMNEFRNCLMLSFYNPNGDLGKVPLGKQGNFRFTEAAHLCPVTTSFINTEIVPWMDPPGRVTILRTLPNILMHTHIDCSLKESGTIQHKWRFVLKGDINKLHFLDKNLNKVYVSDNRCYVLNGGHPHSLDQSNVEKLTICIGSPWHGTDLSPAYVSKLQLQNAMYVSTPSINPNWVDPLLR